MIHVTLIDLQQGKPVDVPGIVMVQHIQYFRPYTQGKETGTHIRLSDVSVFVRDSYEEICKKIQAAKG